MRLLSYNIHKGIGSRDRRYRFERIIDCIERENPDLMCLQEVVHNNRRVRFHDQPKLLAREFRSAAHLFQMNVHYRRGGYGNLLLSRWPLVERHQISLRYRGKKPRGAQIAVIETPEGLLKLVNWHLGLSENERRWQARHLLRHHLFKKTAELPTVIAGDANDWRNKLAAGPLGDESFVHATSPSSRFRTFPAYMPVGSLDKAFYRGRIEIRNVRVARTRQAKIASDHLPLVVDFHLA